MRTPCNSRAINWETRPNGAPVCLAGLHVDHALQRLPLALAAGAALEVRHAHVLVAGQEADADDDVVIAVPLRVDLRTSPIC